MLGYPKVLVCEAGASGPQPRRVAEASGQSQRGFSAYVFSPLLFRVLLSASRLQSQAEKKEEEKKARFCVDNDTSARHHGSPIVRVGVFVCRILRGV